MTAEEYNDKVWASGEMVDARAHLAAALRELGDESKGWGRMPLEHALDHIDMAIVMIKLMMRMDQEPTE